MARTLASLLVLGAAAQSRLAVDLGMNVGKSTQGFLTRGLRVVGIEASPGLAEASRRRFADQAVSVLNVAIADRDGESLAFCVGGQGARYSVQYHLITPAMPRCAKNVTVQSATCARILEKACLSRSDRPYVLKIDVEGQETACLRSLATLPGWLLPEFVVLEAPMWTGGGAAAPAFRDAVRRMESRGYSDWWQEAFSSQRGHGTWEPPVSPPVNASVVRERGCGRRADWLDRRAFSSAHACDFSAYRAPRRAESRLVGPTVGGDAVHAPSQVDRRAKLASELSRRAYSSRAGGA